MKEIISIRIDERLLEKLKAIADYEHRSLSNLAEKLLFEKVTDYKESGEKK